LNLPHFAFSLNRPFLSILRPDFIRSTICKRHWSPSGFHQPIEESDERFQQQTSQSRFTSPHPTRPARPAPLRPRKAPPIRRRPKWTSTTTGPRPDPKRSSKSQIDNDLVHPNINRILASETSETSAHSPVHSFIALLRSMLISRLCDSGERRRMALARFGW
jgi:hypothetical protein